MDTPTVPDLGKPVPNKKVLIVFIAVVAIIIVFVVTAIISGASARKENSSQTQQIDNNSPSKSSANPVQSLPSTQPNKLESWQIYQNAQYSISYPPEWQVRELSFSNGSTGQSIKPVANLTNVNFDITLESVSSVQATRQKQQDYINLGFKSSSMLIDGVSTTKLTGSLPPKPKSGSAPVTTLQSTYIFFERGDKGYFIDYSYTNSDIDLQLENTFGKIISSFKFVQ